MSNQNSNKQFYIAFQPSTYRITFGGFLAARAGQKISKQDEDYLSFLNAIVTAITGVDITSLPANIRMQTVGQCVQVFSDYITNYTELKYGKNEAIRLKASQKFSDFSTFQKFKELGGIFDEALADFLQTLSRQWAV